MLDARWVVEVELDAVLPDPPDQPVQTTASTGA
jgi:hypothetical protein